MKIGVLSDTHSRALSKKVLDDFKTVDLIIHAGDFCSAEDLNSLKRIGRVEAVYGNMDGSGLRNILPKSQIINCESFSIGLFHGEGAPKFLLDRVKKEFKGKKVDAIIFGHSHHPMNEKIDNVLFFNPGSATDTIFAPFRSYGILDITDHIEGRIVNIDES
ncbi:MAG: metallophosphoesterase family protein [Candidatus Omnitrophica bacterium]|nr:metallophosphoesterase family protein [Candidatus Omnitrophota bacterium]